MKQESYILKSLQDCDKLAIYLCKYIQKGCVVTLQGNLGAGKTTMASYLISYLANLDKEEITSPTFNLVSCYHTNESMIWHFDLYRLKNIAELYEIGIEEALSRNYIALIEWPEIAEQILPKSNRIDIILKYQDDFRKCDIIFRDA